jgi:two-component system chemotaxis sensor kinase CheA
MSALLAQFLSEARDSLQDVGQKLMALEFAPDDADLMNELFRLVHTLKGNSGLFEFPEMTRVLHAGEDLMDAVRHGDVVYSNELADRLLDAMDFVGMQCDEIETEGSIGADYAALSARLAASLRQLINLTDAGGKVVASGKTITQELATDVSVVAVASALPLIDIPEAVRMVAFGMGWGGKVLHWIDYVPAEECFFQGEDPFFQARGTPDLLWGRIKARAPWPALPELDAYRCALDFHLLSAAPRAALDEYFRYMPDQVRMVVVPPLWLALPLGETNGGSINEDFVVDALRLLHNGDLEGLGRTAQALLEQLNPALWLASAARWLLLMIGQKPPNREALATLIESMRRLAPLSLNEQNPEATRKPQAVSEKPESAAGTAGAALTAEEFAVMAALVAAQREILTLPVEAGRQRGRVESVAAVLTGCLKATSDHAGLSGLQSATTAALVEVSSIPLLAWLDDRFPPNPIPDSPLVAATAAPINEFAERNAMTSAVSTTEATGEGEAKFGRRAEDASLGQKSLKVDQGKIDLLMNLIGEMVVAKNALPYLAARAENIFGVRELAREIKSQYAVINRIAEEMQGAIMQVRMMPVSFVFQRFPRLVRDISRKLGKEVKLVLQGEETEADKNIIESLGDPLVHIVRNSLDHGFELPEVRRSAGKPATGTLTIRASQESDRVVIEIRDDGKGIDPAAIKRKAYEKGLIDEGAVERLSDQEAVNLVFAAGFSTVEVVSDLSGRGVGMDVVRTTIEKIGGTVVLESEMGKGTRLQLSLPLSMAVTNVMIVESDGQLFGMPMDNVVETVRVPRSAIRTIKESLVTVLRERIVPLKSLNTLLGLRTLPKANAEDELAVLVVRFANESVGLLVDEFRETVDIILKPMTGILAGLGSYSGAALMGDGSVLMVLNAKELL